MPSAASKIVAGNRFHGTAEQMEGAYRRVAVRVFSKQRIEVANALAKAAKDDKVLAAALRSINRSWTSGDGKLYREWFEGYRGLTAKSFELGQEGLSRSVGFDIFNPRLLDAADERAEQLALYIGGTNAKLVTQSIRDIEVEHGSSRVDAIIAAIKGEAFNPEMTLARAERIARTETVGSLNAGEYSAAVESEVFEVKEWLHSGNNRDPRDWHMAMDGERVGINDRFSNGLLHPGEQGVDAAEVINCGCAVLYHVDAEAASEEGGRDTPFQTPVFHDEGVQAIGTEDTLQEQLAQRVQEERTAMFDEMRGEAETMDARRDYSTKVNAWLDGSPGTRAQLEEAWKKGKIPDHSLIDEGIRVKEKMLRDRLTPIFEAHFGDPNRVGGARPVGTVQGELDRYLHKPTTSAHAWAGNPNAREAGLIKYYAEQESPESVTHYWEGKYIDHDAGKQEAFRSDVETTITSRGHDKDLLGAVFREDALANQEMARALGGDEVKLYRGLNRGFFHNTVQDQPDEKSTGTMDFNSASGWSTNYATAKKFAAGHGTVYEIKVPVERIRTGFHADKGFGSFFGEREVVINGGSTSYKVRMSGGKYPGGGPKKYAQEAAKP